MKLKLRYLVLRILVTGYFGQSGDFQKLYDILHGIMGTNYHF